MRTLIDLLLPSAAFVKAGPSPCTASAFVTPKYLCKFIRNTPSLSAIVFDWEDDDESRDDDGAPIHNAKKPKATVYESLYSSYGIGGSGGNSASYTTDDSDTTFEIHVPPPSSQSIKDVHAIIADHISHDRQRVGSLARLAVAFAPSDQPLDIQSLDHVGVHSVDGQHMEIEAVMCDQSDCTSVLVPVTFPHECQEGTGGNFENTESMEACVIENLDELDNEASNTLELMEELHSPIIQYPEWWVSALSVGDPELVQEALTIQRLLNGEEFANDVRNLVCKALDIDSNQSYLISKALVADIGPAGFCFKAITPAGSGGKEHVVEAFFAFDSGEARSTCTGTCRNEASGLRLAVLTAVEGSISN